MSIVWMSIAFYWGMNVVNSNQYHKLFHSFKRKPFRWDADTNISSLFDVYVLWKTHTHDSKESHQMKEKVSVRMRMLVIKSNEMNRFCSIFYDSLSWWLLLHYLSFMLFPSKQPRDLRNRSKSIKYEQKMYSNH